MPGIENPFAGLVRGFYGFMRGVRWLKQHPFCLLLLFIPMVVGISAVFAFWGFLAASHEWVLTWILPARPEQWWLLIGYYGLKGIAVAVLFVFGLLLYTLFAGIFSAPIYDYVSLKVEQEQSGGPVPELNFIQSLMMIGEEFKKVFFIVTVNLMLLLIPGLNVISPLVAATSVGWDVYDYPLARRGFTFRQRIFFVFRHMGTLAGLGVWLLIPGVQLILLPLAVAGGSVLAVEDLNKDLEKSLEIKRKGSP